MSTPVRAQRERKQRSTSQRIAQHALEENSGNAQGSPDKCRTKHAWHTYLPHDYSCWIPGLREMEKMGTVQQYLDNRADGNGRRAEAYR